MTTLNTLNSDMGEILLTSLKTPAQDCAITMPVISGKSAYDLAVENGFVGDLDAWLASIKGWQPFTSQEFLNLLNGELEKSPLLAELRTGINTSNDAINAEIQARIAAITTMNNQLITEANQRILDIQTYSAQLLSETQNRIADIESVRVQLISESNARSLEVQQLVEDILTEQVNRVSELTGLDKSINTLDTKVDSNHTFLLDNYTPSSEITDEITDKITDLKSTYIDPVINGLGEFSKVDKLTVNNVNSLVEGLAIKNLLVGDAQITSINIGTGEVNTLQIANEAVTVSNSVNTGNFNLDSLKDIATLNMPNTVKASMVFFGFDGIFWTSTIPNQNPNVTINLKCNDTTIKQWVIELLESKKYVGNGVTTYSHSIYSAPATTLTALSNVSGNCIYTIDVSSIDTNATIKNCSLMILGTKR